VKKYLYWIMLVPVVAMALTWQHCENQPHPISRSEINNGWIVMIGANPPQYFYVPDKKHEWDCND